MQKPVGKPGTSGQRGGVSLGRKPSRTGNKERKDGLGKGGGAKRCGHSGTRANTMNKLFGK